MATKQEQYETVLQDVKEKITQLKPCRLCVYSNEECTWCSANNVAIMSPLQYGCIKHTTNEEYLEKITREEFEKNQKTLQRLQLELDIMGYEIAAASQTLEKIDAELNQSYNSIKDKDDECIKNHKESKKNRDRLAKAYKELQFKAQDMRSIYDRYVEYFFNTIYSEDDGTFNWKESEKSLVNTGVINSFVRVLVDKTLNNGDNANKIMDFMQSLKGCGIYDDKQVGKFMIRK